ncbi:MAG: pyruvate dehydrogenase complex dihydrolipoamide acetyltransferase [Hirschia sp.]|nr:pyruvate dehydrogenase complex dihydrolipoamide acetyltransferase [Hirschia sp.]MBF18003.1 pyruvate dehydrogenase complex dihydrolipoamide acetyltransferase [Hirschia sp.]
MPINITMPALSPTMEEGKLAKWNVKVGDTVEPGDIIAEIETDKATMEVEAVDEGTVAKILVDAGSEGVKVNAVIAILAEEGEDAKSITGPAKQVAKPADTKPSKPAPKEKEASATKAAPKATPPSETPSSDTKGGRIFASPLAKRLAAKKNIDLSTLKGSGPRGRIVEKDVEAAEQGKITASIASSASVPAGDGSLIMPQVLDDRVYAPDSYELKPLDGMRRTVARRLTESFMQVPHFPLNVDIRLDGLLAARAGINKSAPEGVKISVNDMLIKAAALALMDEPDCNASYSDNGIAYHKSAHISVAVAIDGGLITPVIRNAERKGLAEISREMKDLATRAKERKLKPQEYMGGTFSISNLGMFGIKSFGSIINPPEGMILSVGAGEKRPVVTDENDLEIATVMSVTLSCDHRVIGGAEGAKWILAFKRYVESPESMLL